MTVAKTRYALHKCRFFSTSNRFFLEKDMFGTKQQGNRYGLTENYLCTFSSQTFVFANDTPCTECLSIWGSKTVIDASFIFHFHEGQFPWWNRNLSSTVQSTVLTTGLPSRFMLKRFCLYSWKENVIKTKRPTSSDQFSIVLEKLKKERWNC